MPSMRCAAVGFAIAMLGSGCAPHANSGQIEPPRVVEASVPAPATSPKPAPSNPCADAFEPRPLTADEGLQRATLRVQTQQGLRELPLQRTSLHTDVVGSLALTRVTQEFANTYEHPIEAVYAFPLPHDGAVDDYELTVGERTIRGVMKRRDEARADYRQATREGKHAALLEQERPNLFTQTVGNIPPGARVAVHMHVVHPLAQDDGRYTLTLPTTVGPRYVPAAHDEGDASRITPPMASATLCAPVEVSVTLQAGLPIDDVTSTFHTITLDEGSAITRVALERGVAIPNRDFKLSWAIPVDTTQGVVMVQPDATGDGGTFALTIEPPAQPSGPALPRDLIFVLDTSGSMAGVPLATAKAAIARALSNAGSLDRFQVIRFSEKASPLAPDPLPNTPENLERALAYVDGMRGSGGTEMLAGIEAALHQASSRERLPLVLFVTDGFIGNEQEVFATIHKHRGRARLFALGVGSSVNHHLLAGVASMGRGAVTTMADGEDPTAVVERFYDRIDHPVLTDLRLDWGSLDVDEVVPARLPDVFIGEPLTVYGRYRGKPSGVVRLHAHAGAKRVTIALPIDLAEHDGDGLASMWARLRIDDLLHDPNVYRRGKTAYEARKKRAIALALEHRVMTGFTSFVAIDELGELRPGPTTTVVDPSTLPRSVAGPATSYGHGSGFGRATRVPRIRLAQPQVLGHLDSSIIRRIIRRHMRALRQCYEQQPELGETRLTLRFVIGARGNVLRADSEPDEPTALSECVRKEAMQWRFPAGDGTVQVRYPLLFKP